MKVWIKQIIADNGDGTVVTYVTQVTQSEYEDIMDYEWRHPENAVFSPINPDELKTILADHGY
jgi:hypothetical protein